MSDKLPADVVRLVIAAREVVFGPFADLAPNADEQDHAAMKELDAASEAFAVRVPWSEQPE